MIRRAAGSNTGRVAVDSNADSNQRGRAQPGETGAGQRVHVKHADGRRRTEWIELTIGSSLRIRSPRKINSARTVPNFQPVCRDGRTGLLAAHSASVGRHDGV